MIYEFNVEGRNFTIESTDSKNSIKTNKFISATGNIVDDKLIIEVVANVTFMNLEKYVGKGLPRFRLINASSLPISNLSVTENEELENHVNYVNKVKNKLNKILDTIDSKGVSTCNTFIKAIITCNINDLTIATTKIINADIDSVNVALIDNNFSYTTESKAVDKAYRLLNSVNFFDAEESAPALLANNTYGTWTIYEN